jgi:hypothetical protein
MILTRHRRDDALGMSSIFFVLVVRYNRTGSIATSDFLPNSSGRFGVRNGANLRAHILQPTDEGARR